MTHLRLGTRGSALARWQADHVAALLRRVWRDLTVEVVIITTGGDRALHTPLAALGGKGAFTAELETALRSREIDLAVHSLKDLPTTMPDGLIIGAIPERGSIHDVLISRSGHTLQTLPEGGVIGTGSPRRAAQLLHRRPDLKIEALRGNIDTRIGKALDAVGSYDAIVLAGAGLERLGRLDAVSETLPLEVMLPAPGQGALAVQCREDAALTDLLAPLDHAETRHAVSAERAFLAEMGAGCALPIAAYGRYEDGRLRVTGRLCSPDGQRRIDVEAQGIPTSTADATALGAALARDALAQGGKALLEAL